MLLRLHARLSAMAEALRGGLARPAARWNAQVTELEWRPEELPEAERIALYESVCADLQHLEALTEQLAQLAALLEAHGPTRPPL